MIEVLLPRSLSFKYLNEVGFLETKNISTDLPDVRILLLLLLLLLLIAVKY